MITPILVHGLGPERYGVWALVGSIGLFANLFDLGLGSATIRFVAQHEGRGERSLTVLTISASFWLLVALGSVVILVGGVVATIFPSAFPTQGQDTAAQLLVILVALDVAFGIVGATFQGYLGGMQQYSLLNAIIIGTVLAQAVAFAVVLLLGGKLVALGIALLTVGVLEEISRFVATRRHFPELSLSPRLVDRVHIKRLLGMSFWISSTHLSATIRYRIDTIIVGAMVGIRAAGVYAVGQLLFIMADRFTEPLLTGFLPHAADLAGRGETARLGDTVVAGTRIGLAAGGPICVTAILLARPAIHAWVGPGFDGARLVVVYLLSALLLRTVTRAGMRVLEGSAKYRIVTVLVWSEALLNLTLSVILARWIGLAGVALATLISAASVSIAIGIPVLCRVFDISATTFVLSIVRAHIPAIAAAFAVAWLISPSNDSGLVTVLASGAAIGLAYLLTLSVTELTRAERLRLRAVGLRLAGRAP